MERTCASLTGCGPHALGHAGGGRRGGPVEPGSVDPARSGARRMAALAGEALEIPAEQVLVASTGVIGHALPMEKLEAGIRAAAAGLGQDAAPAAAAIMTTDLVPKTAAVEFEFGGKVVRLGGICKGSGMIAPNLATMLAFITTDADVWPEVLQPALAAVAARTFNCTTV